MTNKVIQIEKEIETFANYLPFITNEELSVFDKQFNMRLKQIDEMSLACPKHRYDLMKHCSKICAKELDKGTMASRSRNKPLGYAGDYLIIDWIYTNKTATDHEGKLWDELYLRFPATQAVKNRKDYFCNLFSKLTGGKPAGISVLDLACGSCRDLADAIAQAGSSVAGSYFHCVDVEKKAITYAKKILQSKVPNVSFQWEAANVLRLRTHKRYDLVWAAGLFDYLSDRYAKILLKRMWDWTDEGGKIVFGNYHPSNPNRNAMEWCWEWFLNHRTKEDLQMLCEEAGIPQECVSFAQEPLGVCIFCIVTRIK